MEKAINRNQDIFMRELNEKCNIFKSKWLDFIFQYMGLNNL